MSLRPVALALAALAGLAACGDAALDYDGIRQRLTPVEQPTDIRPAVRAALPQLPTARFIELPDRAELQNQRRLASQGVLVREEIVGDVATWQDSNRTTLSFRQGVLISTRGIGGDLMSADVSEVLGAVRGGAGQAVRIHRTLGGEDQLVLHSFVCRYGRGRSVMTDPLVAGQSATLVTETCIDSDGFEFENRYWLDTGGTIRQSTQWVSADIGRLNTVLLKD